MDYVFGFALTFKCICYDFISKQNGIKKLQQKF
jgi:hypothetical protein